MTRTILITGAGSGLGQGAAIALARHGHRVMAAAQIWPQVNDLQAKASALDLPLLTAKKLDLLDRYDVAQACTWDFDVLINNAAIGEGGPIADIPVDLVRYLFEVNAIAPISLTQQVVRKWVTNQLRSKVVFMSSMWRASWRPGKGRWRRR